MEKQSADFNAAKLEDFIAHPEFMRWVTQPDDALDAFWQQVQTDYPETVSVIAEARKIVLSLRFESEEMGIQEQQQLWQTIESGLNVQNKPVFKLPIWLRSAAAILVAGLIGFSLFYARQHQDIEISTVYGQRKTLTLPDGSIVTLNANSKLRYARSWASKDIRELWIEGEAFFKVIHLHQSGLIKKGEQFIVHAQQLNVEVLGTSFDVHNRRGLVKVALVTGSVWLKVLGEGTATKNPAVKLRPGDLAEYRGQKNTILKRQVNTQDYSSWKDGVVTFKDVAFKDMLVWIEDYYGYKAVVDNPAIGEKRLSGSISLSSEDKLFSMIGYSIGVSIEKNPSTRQLIIKAN